MAERSELHRLADARPARQLAHARRSRAGERRAGQPIRHEALLGFINRNYDADERGQWFFQNGPQRVYVELGYTPWVVRLVGRMPMARLRCTDQAGGAFEPAAVFVDEEGGVLFADDCGARRESRFCTITICEVFSDHATLADDSMSGEFRWNNQVVLPLQAMRRGEVAARFGFVPSPAANV